MPMKMIKQRPNSCLPACLESFLTDQQLSGRQDEIIQDFPAIFSQDPSTYGACTFNWTGPHPDPNAVAPICWHEVIFDLSPLRVVGAKYRFEVLDANYLYLDPDLHTKLGNRETFIAWVHEFLGQPGNCHSLRWQGEYDQDTGKLLVMNPKTPTIVDAHGQMLDWCGGLGLVSAESFLGWKTFFIRLRAV